MTKALQHSCNLSASSAMMQKKAGSRWRGSGERGEIQNGNMGKQPGRNAWEKRIETKRRNEKRYMRSRLASAAGGVI